MNEPKHGKNQSQALTLQRSWFADISNGIKTFCPSHSVQASQVSSLKAEPVGNSKALLLGDGAALNARLHPLVCFSVHLNFKFCCSFNEETLPCSKEKEANKRIKAYFFDSCHCSQASYYRHARWSVSQMHWIYFRYPPGKEPLEKCFQRRSPFE